MVSTMNCRRGNICNPKTGEQTSCSKIRQKFIDYRFGDLLAGSYCPGGNTTSLQNCPLGSYCPTPDTIRSCPAHKYCPHKTLEPFIECELCNEGSQVFRRDLRGHVILIVAASTISLFLLYHLLVRHSKKEQYLLQKLEARRVDARKLEEIKRARQSRLEKIRPILVDINRRVDGFDLRDDQGGLQFDAEALFDACDKNHDRVLTYDELNVAMNLKPQQLIEFVRRMNESGNENPEKREVTKYVFVNTFLNTIEQSANFNPSHDQVLSLFEEIVQNQSTSVENQSDRSLRKSRKAQKDGSANLLQTQSLRDRSVRWKSESAPTVDVQGLFDSHLAFFLTERQIFDMIQNFKMLIQKVDEPKKSTNEASQISIEIGVQNGSFKQSQIPSEKNLKKVAISRDQFLLWYPDVLNTVTTRNLSSASEGVDIQFENLSLYISTGGKSTAVVDNVTGRIKKQTMTALMGGSGCGKTSLLNALCGRAFYGRVSGSIRINGHDTTIENHRDAVGFVPQDDIVYAELTVRENLIFSGKFQLPAETSDAEIAQLADETLANLGLSRVANSIVGDVARRGLSGGEKKRVNIGLELMARPSILFLDEPTSGLDSNSAMLVMKSLKSLVERQGVTVCSVIHQPRKIIFELFDSLILLGVGGRLIYHGSTKAAVNYFTNLKYLWPEGESVADWLIDISTGQMKPQVEAKHYKSRFEPASFFIDDATVSSVLTQSDGKNRETSSDRVSKVQAFNDPEEARDFLYRAWSHYFKSLKPDHAKEYLPPDPYQLPIQRKKVNSFRQLAYHIHRNFIVIWRNIATKLVDTAIIVGGIMLMSLLVGQLKVTKDYPPNIRDEYDVLTSDDPLVFARAIPHLFTVSSIVDCQNFALSVSVIGSTLVALTAGKMMTEKREEFFREAGSGYSIIPYFLSVNITTTIEQGVQILFASGVALWLRNSLCYWKMYIVAFFFLSWISISWSLLFAIVIPPKNVVLVTCFYMVFCSLLISGAVGPVLYSKIYEEGNWSIAMLSGFFSPARYFVEMMIVSEYRALPPQYGFTMDRNSTAFPLPLNMLYRFSLAQNEFPLMSYPSESLDTMQPSFNVSDIDSLRQSDFPRVTLQSNLGWYWGVLPSFLVGVTIRLAAALAILTCNRSKQFKGSMWKEIRSTRSCLFPLLFIIITGSASFALSVYTILKRSKQDWIW